MRSSLLSTDEPELEAVASRPHNCARLWPLGCVLSLLSVALLITAATKHTMYRSTLDLAVGTATLDVGAFELCYSAGEQSGCRDIDKDCRVELTDQLPDLKPTVVHDCDKFNAARALLLASILLTGIALLTQLLAALHIGLPITLPLSFVLSLLGGLCGLVAMALFVAVGRDEDGVVSENGRLGVSFGLLTAGWVLALLPACCFWPGKSLS